MKRLIFGCGYLGSRVGKRWLQSGDEVYALTRRQDRADELADLGYHPILADITNPNSLQNLPAVNTILFAVGMDRSTYSDIRQVYVEGLQNVLKRLNESQPADDLPEQASFQHFIYISSTGVYGDFGGAWIDESSATQPARAGGKACLEAESVITSTLPNRSTILRFAGIYGPNRVPTRRTIAAKEWDKLSGNGFLNLIHVEDGAAIVERISNHPQTFSSGETFIVSDGAPVRRREYYEFVAAQLGIENIPWGKSDSAPANTRASSSKRVSNSKLMKRLEFEFQHPDFKSGLVQAFNQSDSA